MEQGIIKSPYENNEELEKNILELDSLRENGENKIISLKNEIREIKLNKQIDKETKEKIINNNKDLIKKAKVVENENIKNVQSLISESINKSNEIFKPYYEKVCKEENERISKIKIDYKNNISSIKENYLKKVEEINQEKNIDKIDENEFKKEIKEKLKGEKIYLKSKIEAEKLNKNNEIDKCKEAKQNAYLEKYSFASKVRNNHHSIKETLEYKYRNYLYSFNLKNFLLKYALYIIMILFFIVCVIIEPGIIQGNSLIAILNQSSTKMFYSLGVAGLILIAGTDLSIGRLTGVATSLACMVVTQNVYKFNASIGGGEINFTSFSGISQVLIAVILCIIVCVAFTSLAGFFTSKFKMHPFITTLSTQLLSFGLMMVLFSDTPAFNMDRDIKKLIIGDQGINLIIYAIIAIVIVWFIWNKTKFGKYMYAVGGNTEAASVSGINVFKVTMGIFVMAGVLYGIGGFLEGARVGSGSPNTGSGTELDAIAACVVGGISFSGGIGKISGAVFGTIIFSGLTYCLTYLGFDPNIQFIFKGIIIMAAVCLDSLKYLKKK